MADFQRKPNRANLGGLFLNGPVDDPRAAGKQPILKNVRSYTGGVFECREGLTKQSITDATTPSVHSIKRLSDVQNATFTRIVGAGTKLYYGTGAALTPADTGYSGNPLSLIPYQPDQSPDSWMYVGDSAKLSKIRADGLSQTMGIAPPTAEPAASLGSPATLDIDTFQATTNWVADNAILDNAGLSMINRISTTVTASIGDLGGGGAGWYTIQPADITGFLPGTFVTFGTTGGSNKMVQTVRNAPFTTTVAAITYDSGVTGACSIQPAAPCAFDIDSMVQLNATEFVRVSSITDAPDGTVTAFRCITVGTIAAGQAIAGVASFRAYCAAAPTGTIVRQALEVKFLTNANGGVGYITKTAGLANSNLGVINSRQVGDEDEFVCSMRMSNLSELVEGKLMIDVDGTDTSFTQNTYTWNFRPSDFQKTVTNNQTVIGASTSASVNNAVSGSGSTAGGGSSGGVPDLISPKENVAFIVAGDVGSNVDQTDATTGASSGPVVQASFDTLGQAQWVTMRFKLKDAERVGTAAGRSLQTVIAIRIQLTVSATVNTETVDFDSWFVSGTYGPDVGDIGNPYCYRTRGRSSLTGARSNGGPAIRPGGGISPHRQAVNVTFANMSTAADASWAQVDKIDLYRFGGSLNLWYYVGTIANDPTSSTTLTFADIYPDDWVSTQPLLDDDQGQPFVIIDKPKTGTCNVAGTTVTWVSGDHFNTKWDIGNVVQIGVGSSAVNYATHNRPLSTTKLEIEESGGSQTGVVFNIYAPVLIGQPLPAMWGPLDNFMFGCGDPVNPGRLYWLNGNNPDATTQSNYLDVTPPSEPLMNGCMWDGRGFVWSTDRMFAIYPTFEGAFFVPGGQVVGGSPGSLPVPFRVLEIPNSQGLYTRWGFCVGPKIWQVGKDGIYETTGGEPVSITETDLNPWFPNEGNPGSTVNGLAAPDLGYTNGSTQAKDFRLCWYDDFVFFDFRDSAGALGSIVCDTTRGNAWYRDVYGRNVVMHYGEQGTKDGFSSYPGAAVHELLAGGTDASGSGAVFQVAGANDDGVTITCQLRTNSSDLDEPWMDKQFGDTFVSLDPANKTVTIQPGFDNFTTTPAATAATGNGRLTSLVSSAVNVAKNIALDFSWSGSGPQIFVYEYSFLVHSYQQISVATVEQTNGKYGYQHLRDAYIAHTSTADLTLTVTIDSNNYTYTIPNGGGAYRKTYIVFQPIKGKMVRFQLSSTAKFRLFNPDTKIRLKGWGEAGEYTEMPIPFDQPRV